MAMTARRIRALAFALAAPAFLVQVALAQTRAPAQGQRKPHGAAASATSQKKPLADAGGGGVATGAFAPPPAPTTPAASSADAGVVEAKTTDAGTKAFKFSELDIEGRLKSPQLVYFLRRVRAEFAAGNLGHRTFMREMSETRKERNF